MIGKTISHYRIVEKIGEGGMGVVYRAEDTKLRRHVALKFIRGEAGGNADLRARFFKEAEAAAALDHPNIATIHEIDEVDGQTFLAMALVEGGSLSDKIRAGRLSIDEALRIAIQTAEALQAAHRRGIVHRDIKPDNILFTDEGRVKVMDFGLAHLADQTRITKAGTVLGTPAYMAPEQVRGEKADRRSDVWSLGVVIYEMLTGAMPFQGDSVIALAYAIDKDDPKPVRSTRPDVSPGLEEMIAKALAKSPADRHQQMDELLADIREIAAVEKVSSASTVYVPPLRQAKRPLRWKPFAAAAALVVAALGLYVISQRFQPPVALDSSKLTETILTSYQGNERQATFSPDGSQVAYSRQEDGDSDWDLFVEVVGSGQPVQITDTPEDEISPAWSPDGRSIAFLRMNDHEDPDPVLILIPALGGPEQVLYTAAGGTRHATICWSPDGGYIAFSGSSGEDGPPRIGLLAISGRTVTWLTDPETGTAGDMAPAFSFDGSHLAFVHREGLSSGHNIFVQPLSEGYVPSGLARQITNFELRARSPAWMPDGKSLLYVGRQDAGREGLWQVAGSGDAEPQLVWRSFGVQSPTVLWDPSGTIVVSYTYSPPFDVDIYRTSLKGPDKGKAVPLISTSTRDTNAQYSPDGRRIAFLSGRPMRDVWVCDADGGNVQRLTDLKSEIAGPFCWAPDSREIVFHSRPAGAANIYVVNADTRDLRQLTTSPADDAIPVWSRDGQWIYFMSRRAGDWNIWRMPASGGDAEQLADHKIGFLIQESWDGAALYFRDPDDRYMRLDVGSERSPPPTLAFPGADRLSSLRVGPSGLYFIGKIKSNDGRAFATEMLSLYHAGTGARGLFPVNGYLSSVSPDESSVLTVYGEPEGSDIRMLTSSQ